MCQEETYVRFCLNACWQATSALSGSINMNTNIQRAAMSGISV